MHPELAKPINATHRALSRYGARVAIIEAQPTMLDALGESPIGSAMGRASRAGARVIESLVAVEKPLQVHADDVFKEMVIGGTVPAEGASDVNISQ